MKNKLIVYISLITAIIVVYGASAFLLISAARVSDNGSAVTAETAAGETESVSQTVGASTADVTSAETSADVSSAAEPTEATEPQTEPETEPVTEAALTVPDEMSSVLAANGNTAEQLSALGCRQLITVRSSGSSASIDMYNLIDNTWQKDSSLSCQGYVGANGVTSNMHEGGYASPRGLYSVGEAFYIYSRPQTGLSTFEVTNNTYWVDDPNSKYYNKRVEGTADKDWNSAEHMIDYTTAYEYGFVINYNLEAKYNAGSAIFFHVSYRPTAGCVGTDRDHVLKYLAALNAGLNPYIILI